MSAPALGKVPPQSTQSLRDAELDALTVMQFCEGVRLFEPIARRAMRLHGRAMRAYLSLCPALRDEDPS